MSPPGLAHGWEGAAWITLQRARAGLAPFDDTFARDLAARLRARIRGAGSPAAFIGLGGAALVAGLAREIDRSSAPVAKEVIARWAASTCAPARDDLFLGHPGALIALAELAPSARPPRAFAARCLARTHAAIRRMLAAEVHYLGLAHGLAGLLLAAEHAPRLGLPRDRDLLARGFDRLAGARLIAPGLGTVWTPTTDGDLSRLSGSWCHGSAGIALALHTCHRLSGARAYRDLFDEAIAPVRRLRSSGQTFCCGRSGRAQVLVELYRQTGERRWLAAARRVVAEPTPPMLSREDPTGFHQGTLGLDYVTERLRHPRRLPLPGM